jgi:hypothetical protein
MLFLAGVVLLGRAVLADGGSLKTALPRRTLLVGTFLSLWGMAALCLQIAYTRTTGQPPGQGTIQLGVAIGGMSISLALGTALLLLLRPVWAGRVGVVVSAFIPVAGSGMSGRVRIWHRTYPAACPSWVVHRPKRGNRVRCIGLSANDECLVILKDSTDEAHWQRKASGG